MRFDVIDLYLLRYPYGDELLDDIVSVAALPDAAGLVPKILDKLSCDEIKIRMIDSPEKTVEYFSMYRPDVLIINQNTVSKKYMEAVTEQLENKLPKMPVLISACDDRTFAKEEYVSKYNGYYYATPSVSITESAENIRDFLLTKLVSMDFLRDKIKRCCAYTLWAMKCSRSSEGFDLLVGCVDVILRNPYVRADYFESVIKKTAIEQNVSSDKLENLMKAAVKDALEAMSPFEKSVSFPKQFSEKTEPTYVDFIYTAAEITSKPCKKILRYIEDELFFGKKI